MLKSSFDKWLVTLVLVAVIAGAVWHFVKSNRVAPEQKPTGSESSSFRSEDFHPYFVSSVPRPTNGLPEQEAGFEKLPRDKVEAWLVHHNRDAASLLAAFRALDDTNYLNEAATNFPDNPQVELAVLAHDEFPADRRKWLDLFKASSPSNSLANYFSALDYFQNGNSEAAVQELLAAAGKPQLENYGLDSESAGEELARFAGKLPGEASQTAWDGFFAQVDSRELITLKRLAQGMRDLQAQEVAAGDIVSSQNLAQIGMVLGRQLNSAGGGKFIIDQRVGIAIEAILLEQLNPNTSYDFLGAETPSQVGQENKQQIQSIRQTIQDFHAILPNLTDGEIASYYQHIKIHGGVEAERWAVQQYSPNNH